MAKSTKKPLGKIGTSRNQQADTDQQSELLNIFSNTEFIYANVSISSGNGQEFRIVFGDLIPQQKPKYHVGIVMPFSMAKKLSEILPKAIKEIEEKEKMLP